MQINITIIEVPFVWKLPKNSHKFSQYLIASVYVHFTFWNIEQNGSLLLVQLAASVDGAVFVQFTSSSTILFGGSLKVSGVYKAFPKQNWPHDTTLADSNRLTTWSSSRLFSRVVRLAEREDVEFSSVKTKQLTKPLDENKKTIWSPFLVTNVDVDKCTKQKQY